MAASTQHYVQVQYEHPPVIVHTSPSRPTPIVNAPEARKGHSHTIKHRRSTSISRWHTELARPFTVYSRC